MKSIIFTGMNHFTQKVFSAQLRMSREVLRRITAEPLTNSASIANGIGMTLAHETDNFVCVSPERITFIYHDSQPSREFDFIRHYGSLPLLHSGT